MSSLRLCLAFFLAFQVSGKLRGDDLALGAPANQVQPEAIPPGNAQNLSALPVDAKKLSLLKPLQPGEVCTDEYTGQFWVKFCFPETKIVIEQQRQERWTTCLVYDEDKCCMVERKKKETIIVDVPVEHTSTREEYRCFELTLPIATVNKLPPCDCKDFEIPAGTSIDSTDAVGEIAAGASAPTTQKSAPETHSRSPAHSKNRSQRKSTKKTRS